MPHHHDLRRSPSRPRSEPWPPIPRMSSIVGAGASGGVVALRLAEAGFRVVCLEQGDWHDYSLARVPGIRRLGAGPRQALDN